MDTIVNLCCRCRDERDCNNLKTMDYRYQMERFMLQDYQLIWLNICEPMQDAPRVQERKHLPALLRRLVEYRERRLRDNCGKRLRAEVEARLVPLLDEMGDNYVFFDDGIPQESWVRGFLPLQEFDAYLQPRWMKELLPFATHAHFVVLGSVPCLHEMLCGLAPRMKSLLWIAPDMSYQEQLEDFAEDFYQEYGLAMDIHFLPVGGSYGQMRIPDGRYREPVNVLDFTQDRHVPIFCPPEGSIWLDMASVYEKERRIEARRLPVTYISLKGVWRAHCKRHNVTVQPTTLQLQDN